MMTAKKKKKPTKKNTRVPTVVNPRLRVPGVITGVFYGTEDHGILTCNLTIEFKGSGQGFGNLSLTPETGPDFVNSLCNTFGCSFNIMDLSSSLQNLIGRHCTALYCFGDHNEYIEGLEAGSGWRFLLTAWRRKHFPNETKNPFEERQRSLKQEILNHQERIARAKRELKTLKSRFFDWEQD